VSKFEAEVTQIDSSSSLHIVKLKVKSHILTLMSLELFEGVRLGSRVTLSVKPMNIALATQTLEGSMTSFENILPVRLRSIESSTLLARVELLFEDISLEAILTQERVIQMALKEGDTLFALIQANDISIHYKSEQ